MLNQVLVGPSGLRSSEIALGTMAFGEARAWGCAADEAEAIMQSFVDAGGTTIDTAPNYAEGQSEEIVGTFARNRRDELVLSTKFTGSSSAHPLRGGNSRRSMMQSVEASLRRLQTDRIDLLWLHFWDGTTPMEEILRGADDLVSAGKILYFGISDTPAWLVARAATLAEQQRRTPVVAIQLEYNAATRGVERDLLPMADALDLTAFCWGPLAAGALAGGMTPRRVAAYRIPAAIREVREALLHIAGESGVTPTRLALRWLMESGRARIPIVGARTRDQFAQVLDDVAQPLDSAIVAEVDRLSSAGTLFPGPLIQSPYLRKFAFGAPERFNAPPPRRC